MAGENGQVGHAGSGLGRFMYLESFDFAFYSPVRRDRRDRRPVSLR